MLRALLSWRYYGTRLRRVYGAEIDGPTLARKVQATFDSYARYYYDAFRLPSMSAEQIDRGLAEDDLDIGDIRVVRAHDLLDELVGAGRIEDDVEDLPRPRGP